jgi:hypothetical protein
MKWPILLLVTAFCLNVHAADREVRLVGTDAIALSEIFRSVGRNYSVSNPLTGTVLHTFINYKSENSALVLNCATRNPFFNAASFCKISLYSGRGGSPVRIEPRGENQTEAIFWDSGIAEKIAVNLGAQGFVSEAKTDQGLPKVTIACVDEAFAKVCRLTITN